MKLRIVESQPAYYGLIDLLLDWEENPVDAMKRMDQGAAPQVGDTLAALDTGPDESKPIQRKVGKKTFELPGRIANHPKYSLIRPSEYGELKQQYERIKKIMGFTIESFFNENRTVDRALMLSQKIATEADDWVKSDRLEEFYGVWEKYGDQLSMVLSLHIDESSRTVARSLHRQLAKFSLSIIQWLVAIGEADPRRVKEEFKLFWEKLKKKPGIAIAGVITFFWYHGNFWSKLLAALAAVPPGIQAVVAAALITSLPYLFSMRRRKEKEGSDFKVSRAMVRKWLESGQPSNQLGLAYDYANISSRMESTLVRVLNLGAKWYEQQLVEQFESFVAERLEVIPRKVERYPYVSGEYDERLHTPDVHFNLHDLEDAVESGEIDLSSPHPEYEIDTKS